MSAARLAHAGKKNEQEADATLTRLQDDPRLRPDRYATESARNRVYSLNIQKTPLLGMLLSLSVKVAQYK